MTETAVLRVANITKSYHLQNSLITRLSGRTGDPTDLRALDGVNLQLNKGEILALVGESGSGKSTLAKILVGSTAQSSGTLEYHGDPMPTRRNKDASRRIQMVFQDPYSSLNPRHTIGTIVGAPFHIQKVHTEHGVKAEVQQIMERVGLNPEHYNRYPHEFSGGQRQRIGIARALALQPKLIVCDEPVSALDVSVQAQVVNLLEDLQSEFGIAYVFIAHDLSVVRHISDRVAVMYLGKVMEIADRDVLYSKPVHPYTHALMSAVPVPDLKKEQHRERILLAGDLPSPSNPPSGCVFHTRCPKYREELTDDQRTLCRTQQPVLEEKSPGHKAYCHFAGPRTEITNLLAAGSAV